MTRPTWPSRVRREGESLSLYLQFARSTPESCTSFFHGENSDEAVVDQGQPSTFLSPSQSLSPSPLPSFSLSTLRSLSLSLSSNVHGLSWSPSSDRHAATRSVQRASEDEDGWKANSSAAEMQPTTAVSRAWGGRGRATIKRRLWPPPLPFQDTNQFLLDFSS